MTKKAYHHGDLRAALIKAGLQVLHKDGLDQLSLRGVARVAEVSAMAPYRHFKDKQALLAALSEDGFKELFESLEQAKEQKPGDIDHAGLAYLRFAQKEPESYRLMFTHKILCEGEVPKSLKETSAAAFGSLVDTIEIGMAAGSIETTNSTDLAMSAWALVHGVALLLIDGILSEGPYGEMPDDQILSICQSYFRNGWIAKASTN